ncbi:MAG: hypothetical protein GY854_19295 [Deltaproteobacteria bacterium]|nr:hypothetical protein [Deltaproteobacteria bacterium]
MPALRKDTANKVVIVVDTREQLPYSFDEDKADSVRRKLAAGDYSIEGFEDRVAVERKTMDDFVNTVIHRRKRFYKELRLLAEYELACVVVEASLETVHNGLYVGEAHPNAVFGSAVSICVDFGVPVFFCSDRQLARKFTEMFLLRAHRRLTRDDEKFGAEHTKQPF